MLLRLAFRNVVRQKSRALLTAASVGLGVASLILAAGFIDDILWQLREATIHSQLGHFQVYAPGYFESGNTDPLAHTLDQPGRAIAALRSVEGISVIGARLQMSALLSNGRSQLPVIVEGVEPEAEARIGTAFAIVSGTPLEASKGPSAVVGEGLAAALGLAPGDSLTLLVASREGALNTLDVTLAGISRSPFKDYDARSVRIRLGDAQELAGSNSMNALVVLLDPGVTVEGTLATVRRLLNPADYDVRAWWQLADFYQGTEALYRRQFLVLQVIVSLMVVLGVANTVSMSLHERQAEFGTARALGYGPAVVFRQILTESALLGVAASMLGVVAGALMAVGISAIGISMPPPPNSEMAYVATIRLSPWNFFVAAAVGLFASVAAAILPAIRLSRMSIVKALGHAI